MDFVKRILQVITLRPGKRLSTREYIKEVLMERILGGVYAPGERLIELQIADELNCSQGPVREALRELEALKLVESEPYKGTRVRSISEREIDDAYQVRSVLEQLAAELAAPVLKGNVAALKEEHDAFCLAAKNKDFKTFVEHDMEFHRRILEASGNEMLLNMWDSVVLESRFRLTLLTRIGEAELTNLAAAHTPILKAIEAGDASNAGTLARNLILSFHSKKPDKK